MEDLFQGMHLLGYIVSRGPLCSTRTPSFSVTFGGPYGVSWGMKLLFSIECHPQTDYQTKTFEEGKPYKDLGSLKEDTQKGLDVALVKISNSRPNHWIYQFLSKNKSENLPNASRESYYSIQSLPKENKEKGMDSQGPMIKGRMKRLQEGVEALILWKDKKEPNNTPHLYTYFVGYMEVQKPRLCCNIALAEEQPKEPHMLLLLFNGSVLYKDLLNITSGEYSEEIRLDSHLLIGAGRKWGATQLSVKIGIRIEALQFSPLRSNHIKLFVGNFKGDRSNWNKFLERSSICVFFLLPKSMEASPSSLFLDKSILSGSKLPKEDEMGPESWL
ncbi:hypothetical protein CR513_13819, partial [Mucuna pruriens]